MNLVMAWIFLLLPYKWLIMKQVTKKPGNPKKKGAPKRDDKRRKQDAPKGLTREDLPSATNESIGAMGSGQRQDDN